MPVKIEKVQQELQKERKLVSFDSYDLSVRQLLDMYASKQIVVPPEYQRQFVWGNERQSQLVESVFLGIPVPSLFMATNSDSTWEVVDGVQRLGTMAHFIGGDVLLRLIGKSEGLKLTALEKLPSLNDYSYDDLTASIQLMFTTRPIRVTVLNDKSDLSVRFDLFERLNTGGVSLTQQEIRNCVYRGKFNDELKDLAGSTSFKATIKLKPVDESNGTREELALRFFAYLECYKEFDHSVKDFLNDYMKDRSGKALSPQMRKCFTDTFAFIKKELPNGIVRGNRNITPLNLFEAITVGTALVILNKKKPKSGILKKIVNNAGLKKLTTGATNSNKMVAARIEFVSNALQ